MKEYTDENRGKLQNRARVKQIISFDGMLVDNITPTDIDGFIEYRDKAFVLYEFKLNGAEMPRGQRLALERTVNAFRRANKGAVLFLCKHNVKDPAQDVIAADAVVDKVYLDGKWYNGDGATAKELTERYLSVYGTIGKAVRGMNGAEECQRNTRKSLSHSSLQQGKSLSQSSL
jgi:hypothetical protein